VILAFRLVVALGLVGVVALAAGSGLDTGGVVIAAIVAALGVLALMAARKIETGRIEPGRCESCGGLVARSAPYCKHCGARREPL
jgi:rRNA maturation endonuclease Nob1